MSIIVSGIKLPLSAPVEEAYRWGMKQCRLTQAQVKACHLVKSAVDARKGAIQFVYTVAFDTVGVDEALLVERLNLPSVKQRVHTQVILKKGGRKLTHPPVVVGFGPAGMFTALLLAREGYSPVVLERGGDMDQRVQAVEQFWQTGQLNEECNVQFGEGGAGTFSDGKLTTRIGDPRSSLVLEELVRFGAPADILFKAKPHIGTDKLRNVVKSIRAEIIALGGKVLFNTKVTDIQMKDDRIQGVITNQGEIPASCLVLAIGHSARDTFYMLKERGIELTAKAFSVGARIEHLQLEVNRSLYGRLAEDPRLPIGEYQLSHRVGEQAAYTFCMCPGGTVVAAASAVGGVVVNGMSEYARDLPNANSAFVVSVNQEDFGGEWDSGIRFQQQLEQTAFLAGGQQYKAPAETVGHFLGAGNYPLDGSGITPSYSLGVEEGSLREILPSSVVQRMTDAFPVFSRKLSCFGEKNAVLTGVETRTSSPIRILRTEELCSVRFGGIYPCGEGAGYAGGIMSAAVDGIRIAEQIIGEFSPLNFG